MAGTQFRGWLVAGLIAACSGSADAMPAGAEAARSFRPVSGLFFLSERAQEPARDAALVPDSKIAWDLRVVANGLGLAGITVDVRDQVVRVSGRVATPEARRTFLDVAQRTAGVRKIEGDLEVAP